MSLQQVILSAAILSTLLPVLAVVLRGGVQRLVMLATALSALAVSLHLSVVLRLVERGVQPVPETWVLAVVATALPVLLTGYILSVSLGRENPEAAFRGSRRTFVYLLLFAIAFLSLMRQPSFIAGYDWMDGRGTIHFGFLGKAYLSYLLIGIVLIGHNLERTYRVSATADRYRMRLSLLGCLCLLGFFTFVLATGLLYASVGMGKLVASGLPVIFASAVVAHGFLRRALADVSTPVSRGVVYSSFSALAAGLFVLSIGLAAQVATLTRWSPDEVLIITFGFLAVLGGVILLLSNRFQRTLRRFVDRNFYVNRYDYRARWSQTMAAVVNATEPDGLLDCVAEFLRDVFSAEAITIALRDETSGCIHVRRGKGSDGSAPPLARDSALYGHLSRERKALILDRKPHDLTYVPIYAEDGAWLDATACRVVAPLLEGNDLVGIVGLERRSGGDSFTYEDAALLESIAAHVTSALRSLRLAGELAEAREAELMSQWSSMLLHDLKNYLSPLRLAAANLTEAKHDPDVTLLCARDIRRVAERMERLVHRLAELRANPRLGMAPISSEQIVRAAVADMQLARREGIAVELAFAATRPLLGDMDMLRRVFENLISNALDAMENGGTLRIATDDVQVGGRWRVRITVADTGRGIPESFLKERMFRPFATTKKGGLGLGLYQSRSIVRAHGGELTATSTPGQGTVFQISLDAAVEMPSEGVPFKPRPILRGVVLSERSSKS